MMVATGNGNAIFEQGEKFHKYLLDAIILVHGMYRKFPELRKLFYFRQSDVYKTLAPAVLEYEDSNSESWHHAKKIREVNSVNKSTRSLLFVLKNRVYFGHRLKPKIKLI